MIKHDYSGQRDKLRAQLDREARIEKVITVLASILMLSAVSVLAVWFWRML